MPENRRFRTSRRRVWRAIVAGAVLALLVGVFSLDYTVERGDTLNEIAREHGLSLADLIAANDISNPNLIRVGQILVIPGEEEEPDVIHVVARGDTLGKIAGLYGSNVSALIETNGIRNANLIRIGQKLTVPGSGGPSVTGSTNSDSDTGQRDPEPSSDPNVRSGNFHVVERGESLNSIASIYGGVFADQIARANGIINNRIYVGTRLFLDGPSYVAESSEGGPGTYTVGEGDRLGDIAAAHGTNISNLVEMNDISDVNLIRVGQVLDVPGASSTWVCPVEGGRFFNDWGFPRGGGSRFHEGIDLFAPHGTPVRAPVSGVAKQKRGTIGGNQVNLYGSDGIMYLGSHMSEFGQSGNVGAGDIIGYVGNSGNAVGTLPHLHFGMYLDGVVINPYPSLVANGCK